MKFKNGRVGNLKGNYEDVVVDSKNAPIGIGNLVIGIGLIATGVFHLMWKSFVSGARADTLGVDEALDTLHLVHDLKEDTTKTDE